MKRQVQWVIAALLFGMTNGCAVEMESVDDAEEVVGVAEQAMTQAQAVRIKQDLIGCYMKYDGDPIARALCFERVYIHCLDVGTEDECAEIFRDAGLATP